MKKYIIYKLTKEFKIFQILDTYPDGSILYIQVGISSYLHSEINLGKLNTLDFFELENIKRKYYRELKFLDNHPTIEDIINF